MVKLNNSVPVLLRIHHFESALERSGKQGHEPAFSLETAVLALVLVQTRRFVGLCPGALALITGQKQRKKLYFCYQRVVRHNSYTRIKLYDCTPMSTG